MNNKDTIATLSCVQAFIPFANNQIFNEKFDELDILDYILRTLKHLHKQSEKITGKNFVKLLEQNLGSNWIPDFDFTMKKKLESERELAKNLTKLILSLPPDYKKKVRNHKQIVELSNIAGLLNGSP